MDSSSEDGEETFCLVCTEPFSKSKFKEVWIQCTRCKMWAHKLCTSRDSLANMFYVCDNCDSNGENDSNKESDDLLTYCLTVETNELFMCHFLL